MGRGISITPRPRAGPEGFGSHRVFLSMDFFCFFLCVFFGGACSCFWVCVPGGGAGRKDFFCFCFFFCFFFFFFYLFLGGVK